MKPILEYLQQYLLKANRAVHGLTILLLSGLVAANYLLGINTSLNRLPFPAQFAGWYGLLLAGFTAPYLLYHFFQPLAFEWRRRFIILLFIAPLVFALKMTVRVQLFSGFADASFWNGVVYYPVKLAGVLLLLLALRHWAGKDKTLMGLRSPATSLKPYFMMLLLMAPLIALAAMQPDFQQVYPKLQHALPLSAPMPLYKVLAFEAAYGSDFFTIELFFRGFLVIYLARRAGRYAILPMAVFYCIIHFGKPLGECISSFFGGMLLGIVSYRTGSIWGGLAVHLGVAWLMEIAGWLAHPLSP